ncbi:MAG TPA: hypothetical protein VF132_01550, partial [Rudaea sp.]
MRTAPRLLASAFAVAFSDRGEFPMKACVAVVLSAGLLAACSAPSNPEAEKAAAAPKAAAPETAKTLSSGIDKVNMDPA